jgi:hypothetical protein
VARDVRRLEPVDLLGGQLDVERRDRVSEVFGLRRADDRCRHDGLAAQPDEGDLGA